MKFTQSHEWVALEGGIATIGISEYAQSQLGEIVFVELPQIGYRVQAEEELAVLESTKSAVDIYAPIGGEVIEINERLREHPEKINLSAENEGWLVKLQIDEDKAPLEKLMEKAKYHQYVLGESWE